MRRRKVVILFSIWSCIPLIAHAQTDQMVLTYQEFLKNILSFHPLAKKADLQIPLAEAAMLSARGNLDPSLRSNWNEKNFDRKLYYRQFQGEFQLPTLLGVDIVGGYENTEGIFLNPENTTDAYGLWHLGVEINLLQGLLVNERRTALQQAEVFQQISQNERALLLNNLIYNASKAYLNWQQFDAYQNVLLENIDIARTYFENTRLSFFGGEKTAMDTLEAYILFQDALNLFQKNQTVLVQVRQQVENYLWYDGNPIDLGVATNPEDYENDILPDDISLETATLVGNHPLILSYLNKRSYFEIEQRLKREKLKPKLKVKYQPLLSTSDESIRPSVSLADYKWGFGFSMPILNRRQRADVQQGEIKIQELILDFENKSNELANQLDNSLQQLVILQQQITLSEENLERYRLLLAGETEKFNFGESSVFLLNKRQEKYIDGQLKLIELKIKLQKELLTYLFYSNGLIRLSE